MSGEARKAAVAEYKKRKAVAGIYSVHCTATGERWVGQALDLATIQNRIWFALRIGGGSFQKLQPSWRAHGAESFRFEEVELLDAEELDYVRDRKLKERLSHWKAELGAVLA